MAKALARAKARARAVVRESAFQLELDWAAKLAKAFSRRAVWQ
jgi:hypothetical protein